MTPLHLLHQPEAWPLELLDLVQPFAGDTLQIPVHAYFWINRTNTTS